MGKYIKIFNLRARKAKYRNLISFDPLTFLYCNAALLEYNLFHIDNYKTITNTSFEWNVLTYCLFSNRASLITGR